MIKDLPKQIQDYLLSDNKAFIELALLWIKDNIKDLKAFEEEFNLRTRVYNPASSSWRGYNYNSYVIHLTNENNFLVLKNEDYYALKLAEEINNANIWGIKAKTINV